MYLYSPSLSQISLKNFFGKVVFQNLTKIKMTRNKIGYLAAILKRYNIHFFFFFCRIVIFLCPVHIWCKFHCKIPVGKWFSQGEFHGTPHWAPTGLKVPWSLKC